MSENGDIVCWKCGERLVDLSLPLLRLEVCPACQAELHVCRMCEFFDTAVASACREPVADEVRDKEHANFCDYFRLTTDAYRPVSAEQARARAQLGELFGDNKKSAGGEDPQDALEDLFRKPDD